MIFVTSYPYIGPRHIRVFDYFKKKSDLVFILPKIWKMKDGKVVMKPIQKAGLRIISIPVYFFHSKHFIVRGLLKGWMPSTGRIIKKMSHHGDILYTAIEPNLLVTYFNAKIAQKFGLKHAFFTWQNIPYEQRLSGWKLKLTKWLIRKNISLSSGAICGNIKAYNILKPYLPANFKVQTAPISGVDTEQFRPDIPSNFRQEHNLNEKIILTFVGALDKRKGIANLLNSFVAALKIEPRLYLVMIGAGPLEDFIKEFISQNSLEDKVLRFPWLDNEKLPEILVNSDMFVYPSRPYGGWEEQFGYSIAEAASCGLPVISTYCGSIPDLIITGETGFLIQPDNQNELVEKILILAKDQTTMKRMGESGRQFIIENFSHEIVAQKMENFLRSL